MRELCPAYAWTRLERPKCRWSGYGFLLAIEITCVKLTSRKSQETGSRHFVKESINPPSSISRSLAFMNGRWSLELLHIENLRARAYERQEVAIGIQSGESKQGANAAPLMQVPMIVNFAVTSLQLLW